MKEKLFQYYPPTEQEFDELWSNATFVFDANFFLDLYRYSNSVRENLLEIIESLSKKGRIFEPYQVMIEFHNRKLSVIKEEEDINKQRKNRIKNDLENLAKDFEKIKKLENVVKNDIKKKIDDTKKFITESLDKSQKDYPDFVKTDNVLEQLNKFLNNCIGEDIEINDIYSIAQIRYELNIPPGYEDKNKTENKYGDLILWEQIIKYASDNNKSIIFVTGDKKADWWLKDPIRQSLTPRPELRKEFNHKTKHKFYMYETPEFLKESKTKLGSDIDDESIKEAENMSLNLDDLSFEEKLCNKISDIIKQKIDSYEIDYSSYRTIWAEKDLNEVLNISVQFTHNYKIYYYTINLFPEYNQIRLNISKYQLANSLNTKKELLRLKTDDGKDVDPRNVEHFINDILDDFVHFYFSASKM